MAEIVFEIVGRVVIEFLGLVIVDGVQSYRRQRHSKNSVSSSQEHSRSLTIPPSSTAQHNRAVLISSSNIAFGNDCERLVNIAFQTSQSFPTIMSKCADVHQYLRDQLAKRYPEQYFHIIIGENQKFGFSVDEDQYYADIEQDRYRVLIFTTKYNSLTKTDTHDINSQMLFVWK